MDPGPQPLAPDSYALLVIMAFLENKNMLLVLLVHCFCVANSVLLFSGENMLMSVELKGCVT